MGSARTYPINPQTNREKALQVRNFLSVVDTGGDFWFIHNEKTREDIAKNRLRLARLLKSIRRGDRWRHFDFMEFYLEHFFIPWSHGCKYHDEAKEIFNDL